jgi:hypothetical protein
MSRETQLAVAIGTKETEELLGLWASKRPPQETSGGHDKVGQRPKVILEAHS